MASSEILLIALGSGFLALCGPKCDLLAIAGAVLLAGFLGRVQALIAASAFSLVVLGVIATGHRFPQEFTRNGQFAAAISAIWRCAIFALSSKSNRGSDRSSNNPFEIRLDELTKYVWFRHADGTVEYVSPDACEYLGVAPRDIQDFARYIHPEDVETRQRAMERAKRTGEPQQFRARYLAAIHTARPDGYLDFFNRTWLDFVGQPLKSLVGWKWTSWIHPEDINAGAESIT
jgi:PAS domain-containing protein